MTDPDDAPQRGERARQDAADWFSRLRNAPAEADLEAFAAWRQADPLNGECYDRLEREWQQSKFLANTTLGKSRNLERAVVWQRRPFAKYMAAAALAALVLVSAALFLNARSEPLSYASPADAIRTIMLPDGSRITLDRNSSLSASYSKSERRLRLLGGRARFSVAHDSTRPFMVDAGGVSVVAHGTVFDVELAGSEARVLLLRGSVEVRDQTNSTSRTSASHMLRPGEALVYKSGASYSLPLRADPAEAQWLPTMLTFDATPLRDAVARFNRRNAIQLKLASDRLGNLRVTGAFVADDPIGFARATASMFGLETVPDKSAIWLREPNPKKVVG